MKQRAEQPQADDGKTPFERFTEFTRKLVRVPKDEIVGERKRGASPKRPDKKR